VDGGNLRKEDAGEFETQVSRALRADKHGDRVSPLQVIK
jgi:hypothetical protein